MPDTNPPLHVGQALTVRGQTQPSYSIVGFRVWGTGLLWELRHSDGSLESLTLSQIFAAFKFE